jgi:hypothetical protein
MRVKTQNPIKLQTKQRGWNYDTKYTMKKVSNTELLKFYLIMISNGQLELGSAGYKRMCEILQKVIVDEIKVKRVSYHLRNSPARKEASRIIATANTYIKEYESFIKKIGAQA